MGDALEHVPREVPDRQLHVELLEPFARKDHEVAQERLEERGERLADAEEERARGGREEEAVQDGTLLEQLGGNRFGGLLDEALDGSGRLVARAGG